ncbi:hypothetical protein H7K28_06820 [Paenibacillus polymyxa]|jgi:uncharacterized phage protein (TIGR01671 family)|uniref:YopX family protein n=1 Tax=Paenibacillus polymyxa TaxID=1406 RepID=UPI001580906B|nr:YopX family protein [Paenibacillus polymyxa]MBY0020744.1 hypothetical protein [Paenibacillus polymyxa]MBY0059048.1 hypothetical protein [Paenibacillus polymyxa]MBY0069635.1 hypothetical protein [Paenibacillus polymyxa]MBY0078877.1 hypothetical protein [Paenibacillus polymyxa]MBZ6441849.1 YopX family protein [Paenibacillus polymyxa]
MSRPIKFRAWDKYNKKWIDRVLAGCNSDGTDYVCNLVWNDEVGDWMHFDEGCGDIVQYTGLKDRNGKEIYEGDILKWYDRPLSWYRDPDNTSCSQIIDVAVFSDGSFRTRKYSELLINLCGTKDFNFLERSEIEVVGNIYENPSLLEDTP